jgi:hypothetical protein
MISAAAAIIKGARFMGHSSARFLAFCDQIDDG